ncbi:MAG: DUF2111 domain-containing protein [Methanomicrobiales archaeon]|nr:DUF2111 domain-containing protein [Methanomicrobiales archaeon]MDI6876550.1 DUF2111 domain-containing protein [Methanomicrobiales archaeon]
MERFTISEESTADDLIPIAMSIHAMLYQLPITARSRANPGVRVEEGRVIDRNYSGPVLEEVLQENRTIKKTPRSGTYRGIPVIVAPIQDTAGTAIGAIGVVDISGIFDLAGLMEHRQAILRQIGGGETPSPEPSARKGGP